MAIASLSGSARNDGSTKVQFIRARLGFGTPNLLGAALKIGRLPARAFISQVSLHKEVVFNSTTSDTISLGTTSTATEILAATDVHAATGFVNVTAAAGLGLAATGTADVDVFAKWTSGGGTPSTGDVTFVIAFIPDNDG